MDRDIAVNLLGKLKNYKDKIEEINDNKYVPHITQQPTNQTAGMNEQAVFTVVANNVKAYQWEFQVREGANWQNSSGAGNTTSSVTYTVTSSGHYRNRFRCKLTGLDNSIIYSNVVQILEPET